MHFPVFFIILTLFLQTPARLDASCGVRSTRKTSSRIVGGTQSTPNKWPWMAAIFRNNGYICGGAIINSHYILTAAHCVVVASGAQSPASAYGLILGAHDLRNSGTRYLVATIIVPSNYKQNAHYNDLALLKTSTAIQFNTKVAPICLPTGNMGKLAGKSATIAGWGATNEGGTATPILREVTIPVITNGKCNTQYRKLRKEGIPQGITEHQICAGKMSGGQDSCQGDSGGPMIISKGSIWTVAGIVSFGHGCAQKGFPGVYTRVDKYLSWINSNSKAANATG